MAARIVQAGLDEAPRKPNADVLGHMILALAVISAACMMALPAPAEVDEERVLDRTDRATDPHRPTDPSAHALVGPESGAVGGDDRLHERFEGLSSPR